MVAGKPERTARVFGTKWAQFPEMHKFHEEQFLDWITPVSKNDFKGKLVLDAGCGQGRHVALASKYGAKMVFGIDASDSVDVAYQNTKHLPNVCIVQADIYNLPFRDKTFDYAYSIGVLHHLPAPERGFDALVRSVKSKGSISTWVYGRQSLAAGLFDLARRAVLAHLPLSANYAISLLISLAAYPLIHGVYVPLNNSRRLKPIASKLPLGAFMTYLGKMPFRMLHEILCDQCIAPIAFYFAKDEFARWFSKPLIASFSVTERNKNSWRGHALLR
jgi:SAM-dependent methyltransferase